MAYTTIDDPSAHFQTKIYTGNGGSASITNDGNSNLQPDWIWIKRRTNVGSNHQLQDTSRGLSKAMESNSTSAEYDSVTLTATSDGFSMNSSAGSHNQSSNNYVAWQWKANGGTTSSNSDGSITSTVQANTTAGFSIITYTGTGSAATLGHGLGSAPEVVIVKSRSQGYSWIVYHKAAASDAHTDYLGLDDTDALIDFPMWNDTAPTSTVFSVGTDVAVNNNTKNYVAYCFDEKQGYSKFGSYTGNDATDGPFVYLGFKPAWVIIKHVDGSAGGTKNWYMYDNKRSPQNVNDNTLIANGNGTESENSAYDIDMLSNGFKIRNAEGPINNAASYIYMAFAEHPFVSSKGVPVTAK